MDSAGSGKHPQGELHSPVSECHPISSWTYGRTKALGIFEIYGLLSAERVAFADEVGARGIAVEVKA